VFDRLFQQTLDYTQAMDALQFAWDARRDALAQLPADSSAWTDDDWAVSDAHFVSLHHPGNQRPRCRVRGIVTATNYKEHAVIHVSLGPPPMHPFVPTTLQVSGYRGVHRDGAFAQLVKRSVGERVAILGELHDPGELWPEAVGCWFTLEETLASRRRAFGSYA
jgi:hypothetical protein